MIDLWPLILQGASSLLRLGLQEILLSSAIFALVYPLCRLFSQRRPALCHALWSLVLLRLILPPGLSHRLSLSALAEDLLAGGGGSSTAANIGPHSAWDAAWGTLPEAAGTRPGEGSFWALLLVSLWLAGFLTLVTRGLRQRREYEKLLRASAAVRDPRVIALAKAWSQRFHIRRRIDLRTSAAKVSPFTVGSLRPIVYLPREVLENPSLCEAALAHEWAHVARWDSLTLCFARWVRALYFFHPVVWIAGAELDLARERACDAAVLAEGKLSARRYADSLLTAAELKLVGLATLNLITPKRRWTMRLKNILRQGARPRPRKPGAYFAITLFLGLFLLPLASQTVAENDPTTPAASLAGWQNPLPQSRITAAWGPMKDPWTHQDKFHQGIDLAAKTGTPVHAPRSGVVELATSRYEAGKSYGTVLIIDHGDGLKTFYAHLAAVEVKAGQRIDRGDIVARVGSTGRSTGPHLHFEAWRDGQHIDPATLIAEWS